MEVMHRAIVKSRTLRALPGEMTNERINGATLPVKIETARRAIAACTDLPELLQYRDQAEGLAAAVRVMKNVGPEMIRQANELMADAWRKGGELLAAYSSVHTLKTEKGHQGFRGIDVSPRVRVANSLGLQRKEVQAMVRIYRAPREELSRVVRSTRNLEAAARKMPPTQKSRGVTHSDALRGILRGTNGSSGIGNIKTQCTAVLAAGDFKYLTPDERKVVKAKITEIMELLDEMDRLCK